MTGQHSGLASPARSPLAGGAAHSERYRSTAAPTAPAVSHAGTTRALLWCSAMALALVCRRSDWWTGRAAESGGCRRGGSTRNWLAISAARNKLKGRRRQPVIAALRHARAVDTNQHTSSLPELSGGLCFARRSGGAIGNPTRALLRVVKVSKAAAVSISSGKVSRLYFDATMF